MKTAHSLRPSFWRREHHLDKMSLKELVVAYFQYPAILAYLLLRALQRGVRPIIWRHAVLALAVAIGCAAADEYHQSFVASRTGSSGDVLIDAFGALLGIAICSWTISRHTGRTVVARAA